MDKVTCPTFIVHGQKDKLIPIAQAYALKDKCAGPTFFLSPPNMTHNDFDFYEDLIRPLMRFLCQIKILQNYEESGDSTEETPDDLPQRNSKNQKSSRRSTIRYAVKEPAPKENEQLKFSEEFFIPPHLKQAYIVKAAQTLSTGYLTSSTFIAAPQTETVKPRNKFKQTITRQVTETPKDGKSAGSTWS